MRKKEQVDRSRARSFLRPKGSSHRMWETTLMAASFLTLLPRTSEASASTVQEEARVEELIELLGSGSLDERERATEKLKKIGEPALEALRRAADGGDPERGSRAKAVLEEILLTLHGRIAYWGRSSVPNPFVKADRAIFIIRPEGGRSVEILGGIYDGGREIRWIPGHKGIVASIDIPLEERVGRGVFCSLWSASADGTSSLRIGKWKSTSDFAVSTDGERIAVVVHGSGQGSNLWMIDRDGRNEKALTSDCRNVWDPTWSPDGKEIVFRASIQKDSTSGEDDGFGSYRITMGTLKRERLAREFSFPTYRPDGKTLVVLQLNRPEKPKEIYLLDRSGAILRTLAKGATWERPPRLSRAGTHVAFVRAGSSEIAVVDIEGRTERIVAKGSGPTWSPDGNRLAYERDGWIHILDLETDRERKVIQGSGPVWSN